MGSAGPFRVDAASAAILKDGGVSVTVQTRNITSLKFFLDGHLALSIAVETGPAQPFTVPAVPGLLSPATLRIEGYDRDRLAAVRNLAPQGALTLEATAANDGTFSLDDFET
jgi:hypothetical protein